jgi:RNA polymerase II-associated protein 1
MPSAPLIGSVFERKTSSPKNPITPANATGFPTAQHRSKSAFARAREDAKRQGERGSAAQTSRVREAPVIVGSGVSTPPAQSTVLPNPRSFHPSLGDDSRGALQEADWRKQISDENERRVAEMSEEERAQEREEILARFGGNISEVLSKARAKRQHDGAASGSAAALKSKELTSIPPQGTSLCSTMLISSC